MVEDRWWTSDRRYFSLVAEPEPVEGGVLFTSPTHADLPPGFVASVPGAACVPDPARWVGALEDRAVDAGARLLRAYLPEEPTPLATCLAGHGFTPRPEVGVVVPPGTTVDAASGDEVAPVESEADWADELALQRTIERAWCDGDIDAGRWVALERAQSEGGRSTRLLVRHRGVAVASFGQVAGDPLRRPKSHVVHPAHRGRGHTATAFAFVAAAGPGDDRPVGAIAVEGGAGHRSYARLGLRTAHRFVEWSRLVRT